MEERERESGQVPEQSGPAGVAAAPLGLASLQLQSAARTGRGVTPAQMLALQARAGNALVTRALLQRQHVDHFSGRQVGSVTGPDTNIREDVLDVMTRLAHLWSIPTNGAVAAERAAVTALAAGSSVPQATIPLTIAALRWNEGGHLHQEVMRVLLRLPSITGSVGQAQTNNRADLQTVITYLNQNWYIPNDAAARETAAARGHTSDTIPDSLIPATIAGIARLKRDYAAGNFQVRDLMAGTHGVTAAQHAAVEGILNPGATVTTTSVGGVTTTTTTMPTMTGGGPGGQYETRMIARLRALLQPMANELNTRRATGVQGFPLASAADIARAAQEQVEEYFGSYIQAASRQPGDLYHPGSFDLSTMLRDQSTRPLSPREIELWTEYFMTSTDYGTQAIQDAHHPTDAEFTRVRDLFITGNTAMVRDAINSWPAEAGSGPVYMNPWRDPNPATQRTTRWDIFTTLIHEMMHKVTHPNFTRASELLEDRAGKILREGMAEVMRHELWDGPGNLVGRIASMPALRRRVEGATLPYSAAAVVYHGDYSEIAEARQIVAQVGMPNAKAAFFLGRVELLGLGAGTHTRGGASLAGRAEWSGGDAGAEDAYRVQTGDTYVSLQRLLNAPAILDDAGTPLAPAATLTPGQIVRVRGLRWVRAVPGDTVASMARQNGVPVPEFLEANRMPTNTPGTTPIPQGERKVIPLHRVI